MPNFNSVTLLGHLVRDPELKTGANWTLAKSSIAVSEYKKPKNGGEAIKETAFVDFTVWGKSAEELAQSCRKGSAVLIVGKLKQENWTAQDGTKRSKLSVNVDSWMVDGRLKNQPSAADQASYGPPDGDLDSIPF